MTTPSYRGGTWVVPGNTMTTGDALTHAGSAVPGMNCGTPLGNGENPTGEASVRAMGAVGCEQVVPGWYQEVSGE